MTGGRARGGVPLPCLHSAQARKRDRIRQKIYSESESILLPPFQNDCPVSIYYSLMFGIIGAHNKLLRILAMQLFMLQLDFVKNM